MDFTEVTPENDNQQPLDPGSSELAQMESSTLGYLDERFRMLHEVIELYFRYSDPQVRYNQVIGALADEMDALAKMLNYEDVIGLTERLNAENEALADSDDYDLPPRNENFRLSEAEWSDMADDLANPPSSEPPF